MAAIITQFGLRILNQLQECIDLFLSLKMNIILSTDLPILFLLRFRNKVKQFYLTICQLSFSKFIFLNFL